MLLISVHVRCQGMIPFPSRGFCSILKHEKVFRSSSGFVFNYSMEKCLAHPTIILLIKGTLYVILSRAAHFDQQQDLGQHETHFESFLSCLPYFGRQTKVKRKVVNEKTFPAPPSTSTRKFTSWALCLPSLHFHFEIRETRREIAIFWPSECSERVSET